MVHAQQLAYGCAGARAIVAVAVVADFRVHTGLIRHGSIRAGVGVCHGQIKQVRLADQRHLCYPNIKADAALLKIPHNTAGRIQPKGTAPRQHNSVDDLRRRQRLEQFALSGGRPAAAYIQPRRGAVLPQQKHRAACARRRVLSLTDLEIPE